MKVNYCLVLSFVFFLSSINVMSQQTSHTRNLQAFVKDINAFRLLHTQEKVYLHFDNNAYYAGEKIWFKVYVVEAEDHASTEISKIVYVDLMSPEGYLVETKKLKIENGRCHAEFSLSDTMFAGYYEVRAYTLNMLNFGDECMFSRVFPVYDKPVVIGDYATKTMRVRPRITTESSKNSTLQESLVMTFFPEGGNLVKGIYSKVAFKSVDELGQSVAVHGVVCNSKGEEICPVATSHQGAGMFMLSPDGTKSTVKVLYKNKMYKFPLPECQNEGYVMSTNNTSADVLIVQLDKHDSKKPQVDGLTISCRGKVYLFDTVHCQSSVPLILRFPKKNLPSGVNLLTLFDAAGQIHAERLFFVDHLDKELQTLKVTKSKSVYKPLEEVFINLQAIDPNGLPVETNLSISITDASFKDLTYDTGNMMTNLLLSSDLKGFIEDPKQYFDTLDNQRKGKLDMLLMTQGWRRYSWKQAAGMERFNEKYDVEHGLAINGSILMYDNQGDFKKMSDMEVSTLLKCENATFEKSAHTNEAGNFFIHVPDFQGKADLTLRASIKVLDQKLVLPLNRFVLPAPRTYSFYETAIPFDASPIFSSPEKSQWIKGQSIKEVTVNAKKRKRLSIDFDHPNVVFDFQETYDFAIDHGQPQLMVSPRDVFGFDNIGMFMHIHSYLGRIQINNSILYDNKTYDFTSQSGFGIIKSNIIPTERIERIALYTDIATRMKHLNKKGEAPQAVISFNSYKNGFSRPKNQPNLRYTTLQGYSNVCEFFSPQYTIKSLPDVKDHRRTLYWNPNVNTDSTGNALVRFFNNTACKAMDISVEAITLNGMIGVTNE